MSETAFYVLSFITLLSASGVVLLRNPVHCAMSLVLSLFSIAVCFAALQAHLVAALQIIVYTGAVMVLFLFVIMLLNLQADPDEASHPFTKIAAAASAAMFAVLTILVMRDWVAEAPEPASLSEEFGTTKELARALFTDHLVAFELTSILLLVAVVGAVVIARRDEA
jgi:NADH-quinone oxidoreductase subunit J